MVYNRQVIKDKFENDVRDKIHQTQIILNQLKSKMTDMEKTSSIAKQDVQRATDSIIQQLEIRKLEMTQQIDLLSQPQIVSLHERIHSTCVTLGSLQSTLNNIDSFDYSNQFFRLLEPTVSWPDTSIQSEIKVEVPTENITEMIGTWGSVQLKPIEEQIPVLSVNQPVNNNMPSSSSSLKSVTSAKNSNPCKKSTDCTQRFESSKENQWTVPKDSSDFQIEKWLRGMKIHQQASTDSDDFEMLEPIKPLSECNKTSSCVELGNNNAEKACDGEDGSSIVCVESDDLSFGVIGGNDENDEIRKWLQKPKKQRRNSVSSPGKISSEIMQTYLCKKSKTSTKSNLDFPCLRLDPNTWIKRKATDKSAKKSNVPHTKADLQLCLQMSQSDIIPPTYALPYPFWLKKY